ncbi:MAG: hypothetical protein ACD_12C00666G0003 [uncultured bacterium]|nr:MAG: hypothetical protein ACD_12C00666G0003 [uncultured bacterium]
MVIRQRKQIRLKKYDYSDAGWYFVTICTQNMECLFGDIVNNKINLNIFGKIVKDYWLNIKEHFDNVELNKFQIMPNHIHGIIVIRNTKSFVGNDPRVVPNDNKYDDDDNESVGHGGPTLRRQTQRQQQSLFCIIQWFKTITTNIYIKGVKNNHFPRFDKRIWQKSFYDHIIRNEYDLNRIRQYIRNNTRNWDKDRNNLFTKK